MTASTLWSAFQSAGRRWGGNVISHFPWRTFSRRWMPLLFLSHWPALRFISKKKKENRYHVDQQSLSQTANLHLPLQLRNYQHGRKRWCSLAEEVNVRREPRLRQAKRDRCAEVGKYHLCEVSFSLILDSWLLHPQPSPIDLPCPPQILNSF